MDKLHTHSPSLTSAVPLELIHIPAGEFLMGSDPAMDSNATAHELPQHALFLDTYFIGRTPVTMAQFELFVKATGYRTTAEQYGHGYNLVKNRWEAINGAYWRSPIGGESMVEQKSTHPVTLVSWYDALAFCDWATEVTQFTVSLPSEAEWEQAARGVSGFIYPWGNDNPTDRLCNFDSNIKDTSAVGAYSPQGDSPFGCTDMAGNVLEWTRSLWGKDIDRPEFQYPYSRDKDERENIQAPDEVRRIVRGGAWDDDREGVRAAYRIPNPPLSRNNLLGFRVAASSVDPLRDFRGSQ